MPRQSNDQINETDGVASLQHFPASFWDATILYVSQAASNATTIQDW